MGRSCFSLDGSRLADHPLFTPRSRRHTPGGYVYHALSRGVARRPLFKKDRDYEAFLSVLDEALERHPKGKGDAAVFLLTVAARQIILSACPDPDARPPAATSTTPSTAASPACVCSRRTATTRPCSASWTKRWSGTPSASWPTASCPTTGTWCCGRGVTAT